MAKRTFPLICIDRRRTIGEFDTIVCTDIDAGFVANVYFENQQELTPVQNPNLEYLSEPSPMGIYAHAKVERIFGRNPSDRAIKTLLAQAMKKYISETEKPIHLSAPTASEMIMFLEILIQGNLHQLAEAGSDVKNRQVVETSLAMLQHIKQFIESNETEK